MQFGHEMTAPGLHEWLIGQLADRPRHDGVLDLGCGEGAWLRRLEAAGFTNLHGIDLDAEPQTGANIDIRVANLDAEDVGLGDQKFGLVTIVEVIEHATNPGRFLHHAASHLKQGGLVVITTPNIQSLIQRLKFFVTGRFTHFDRGSNPTHYQPVLLEAWRRMLPIYGLEVVNVTTWPQANVLGGINKGWQFAAGLLAPVLGNPFPGECLCIRLQRSAAKAEHPSAD